MADRMTTSQRSFTMSRIRSARNASTELRFLELLKRARVTGWRRNAPLIGRPDLVFRNERIAVFLDGCFWHACPQCARARAAPPKSNVAYWSDKLRRNAERDREVTLSLRRDGWIVLRIWEHVIRREPRRAVGRLRRLIGKQQNRQQNRRSIS
jgi:DNA mismatch endonuclease (patch repair protein)